MIRRPPRSTLFPTRRSSDLWKICSRSRRCGRASPLHAPAHADSSINPTKCSSRTRSEEHTSELQSQSNLVCRLLLEKKKQINQNYIIYIYKILYYVQLIRFV